MKRILLVSTLLLIATISFGQFSPVPTGNATSITANKGAGSFDSGVVTGNYIDTTKAQRIKAYKGAIIATGDSLWLRSVNKWVLLNPTGSGTGTVTSVGLTMPSAFTVSNSPITISGNIGVTANGTTSEYIRGNGTLQTFPTIPTTTNLIDSIRRVGLQVSAQKNGNWVNQFVLPDSSTSGNYWSLTGNAGTTSANFIGTTDNNDLIFKRNSIEAGRISSTNTSFGLSSFINNTTGFQNTAIGYISLNLNTTGYQNTAVGLSLSSNTTGFSNTAVGVGACDLNDYGYRNTAVGRSALSENNSGNSNTAIGSFALLQSGGNYNTALGDSALNINYGDYNIGIGYNAITRDTIINNATAIGSFAYVGQSNSLVLGSINGVNGATASTNVGIGTTTPTHLLHISAADSNVLRLQGLIEGLATDSMLTIDSDGRVHKRVIPTGGGSSIQPFQVILDVDTTLTNVQASYLFDDISTDRTITLPATPTDGLEIQITSYWDNSDSYTLTILPNTSQDIEGLTSGYVIGVKGTVKLKWYDTVSGWQIINEKL